jgi:hypothetical protein
VEKLKQAMPRFVILQHDAPGGTHFDFMLESGSALRTWSLPSPPTDGAAFVCELLADHRPAYLDYEGPVPGGRGSVRRWDAGEYSIERQEESDWAVLLFGEKINGRAVLHCDDAEWQFSFSATPRR